MPGPRDTHCSPYDGIVISSKSRCREMSRYKSKYYRDNHEGHYDGQRRDEQARLIVCQGRDCRNTKLFSHSHGNCRLLDLRQDLLNLYRTYWCGPSNCILKEPLLAGL